MEDAFFDTPWERLSQCIHPFCFFLGARQWRLQRLQSLGPESEGISLVVPKFPPYKPLPSCCSVQIYWTHMCSTYFLKLGIVSISWVSKQSKRHNTQSSFFVWWGTNFLFERLRWVRTLCQWVWCISFVNFIWMRKPFLDSYFLGIVMGWLNIHIIIPKVAESKMFLKISSGCSGWVGRFLGCSCCVDHFVVPCHEPDCQFWFFGDT